MNKYDGLIFLGFNLLLNVF